MLHAKPRARWPHITVIVPTKDAPQHLARCLDSIFSRSTYPSFRVLLVDNGTTDPEARRIFEQHPVDVVPLDEPFNFSRLNNVGVAHADGELVVFLNNDTEVQTPEWLEAMVSLAERDGVGAVGPLLLYPDGTVQHAGVVLGLRGTADHIKGQVGPNVHPRKWNEPGEPRKGQPPTVRQVRPGGDGESGGDRGVPGREALIALLRSSL